MSTPEHRLERVGEDRRLVSTSALLLALAEPHEVAEPERTSDLGERRHVHDRRPELGELALGQSGMLGVGHVGHDEAEHRIAEELQGRSFVTADRCSKANERWVRAASRSAGSPKVTPRASSSDSGGASGPDRLREAPAWASVTTGYSTSTAWRPACTPQVPQTRWESLGCLHCGHSA